MRLRLFRGRNWPGRRSRDQRDGADASSPTPAAAQQPSRSSRSSQSSQSSQWSQPSQSGQSAAHPGGARGTHRKAGRMAGRTAPGVTTATGVTEAPGAGRAAARAAIRIAPEAVGQSAPAVVAPSITASIEAAAASQPARAVAAQPWYATARHGRSAAGQRDCGCLEEVLVREWAVGEEPAPEAITAINRLAALPLLIKEKLAVGLDAIHVGSGGVPDLDDMAGLAGVPLPSARATWDSCAGAYGERKIVVGSRPSPTPDVMCHEVGHALDDIDGAADQWQSDSTDFRTLYSRCVAHLASEFHRHGGSLGRREFFADAFAAIASSQRPALVEMLSGDTRTALDVMLYFNVRYGM